MGRSVRNPLIEKRTPRKDKKRKTMQFKGKGSDHEKKQILGVSGKAQG